MPCFRLPAAAAITGSTFGIISWLCYAKIAFGEVTVATTGLNTPLICGNVVSLGTSLFLSLILSYVLPDKRGLFDWTRLDIEITTAQAEVSIPT